MRFIGNVEDKAQAERITAWLITLDISTHSEDHDGKWDVWVRDEDQIEQATRELEAFRAEPNAPKYRAAVDEATRIVRDKARKLQQARHQQVQMTSDRWNAPIHRVAPLTVALVVICVIVWLATNAGEAVTGSTFRALALGSVPVEVASRSVGVEGPVSWNTQLRLYSLTHGELWRAVTPVFLHFGVLHLLFNMYWMVLFGRQIEYRYGSVWLLALIVLVAIPSNLIGAVLPAEFDGLAIQNTGDWWVVLLGGMSGVLYGLLGYVWMKMVFDPKSGLQIAWSSIAILMIWLVICMAPGFDSWFGFRPANWAHGTGLFVGLAIGYWPKLLADIGIGNRDA